MGDANSYTLPAAGSRSDCFQCVEKREIDIVPAGQTVHIILPWFDKYDCLQHRYSFKKNWNTYSGKIGVAANSDNLFLTSIFIWDRSQANLQSSCSCFLLATVRSSLPSFRNIFSIKQSSEFSQTNLRGPTLFCCGKVILYSSKLSHTNLHASSARGCARVMDKSSTYGCICVAVLVVLLAGRSEIIG